MISYLINILRCYTINLKTSYFFEKSQRNFFPLGNLMFFGVGNTMEVAKHPDCAPFFAHFDSVKFFGPK